MFPDLQIAWVAADRSLTLLSTTSVFTGRKAALSSCMDTGCENLFYGDIINIKGMKQTAMAMELRGSALRLRKGWWAWPEQLQLQLTE